MDNYIKILTNVFLCIKENTVIPVNIYFNDTIKRIEKLSSQNFTWEDIDTIEKKKRIVEQIPPISFPKNIDVIEGDFNLVIPGAIDPHVHFNTPGFEFRDTFELGTIAAAYGGVTTIIDMPCTSLPPVTSLENFETKLNIVKKRSLVDFAFWGGVCGNSFENNLDIEKDIQDLNKVGVAAYKSYLISGMNSFKDLTLEQMKIAAKLVGEIGKPLGVHAEDKNLVESRRKVYLDNKETTWKYYCNARDSLAEEVAINDMISIAEASGAKVHIVHLSSQLGLNAIRNAQQRGIKITSETCPHYLKFTQNDFENSSIRNYLKTAPPVKVKADQVALWTGLQDNSLAFVTTDHAGCDPGKEKKSDNFWEVYGGIPGVEHRVPYLFSEGFRTNKLSLDHTIKLLSTNVAEYFNLRNKGRIKENYDADFALINLWENEIVKSDNMQSKGKYTPFDGIEFNCKVDKTILRGNVVMDRNRDAEKEIGYGKFIEVH
jgi:allantoinase